MNDIKKINFPINLPEIIVHSSNIGTAKIASSLGHKVQDKYFNLLGFLEKVNIEIDILARYVDRILGSGK